MDETERDKSTEKITLDGDSYFMLSPDIPGVIKLRRIRWVRHVGRMRIEMLANIKLKKESRWKN
jgi:hypothetical protein